jgi:protein-disulfide isomerase
MSYMDIGHENTRLILPVGERDHIQGFAEASLTLVEYGDYECPACGQAYPMVKAIQQVAGKQLRFVFRNFPLVNAHPYAEHAAEAAEAAASQGHFWPMHDILFENQRALEDQQLVQYALELGLDARAFTNDLDQERFAPRVREDFMSGIKSGVNGTPTFFINGLRYDGDYDVDSMLAAFEEANAQQPQPRGQHEREPKRGRRARH